MLKFSTYFYTTAQSNTVFHSLNESVLNESSEPVIQRSIQMVSLVLFLIESAVLNESIDLNDSVSHLLKQRLAATY